MANIHEILRTIIFKHLNFYDKHTIERVRKFMNQIHITDLFDIEDKYLDKLAVPASYQLRICRKNVFLLYFFNSFNTMSQTQGSLDVYRILKILGINFYL